MTGVVTFPRLTFCFGIISVRVDMALDDRVENVAESRESIQAALCLYRVNAGWRSRRACEGNVTNQTSGMGLDEIETTCMRVLETED
jgi:hypothetical protein